MGGRGASTRGRTELTSTPNATDAQIDAMKYYQTQGYYELNSQLRNGDGKTYGEATKHKEELDKLMTKTNKEITVYRGYNEDSRTAGGFKDLKPGQTLTDKGYTSTSRSLSVAKKFADEGTEWVEKSKLSKGTKVIDMNRHSWNKSFSKEKEVLVSRGNTRTVVKVDVANKIIYTRY